MFWKALPSVAIHPAMNSQSFRGVLTKHNSQHLVSKELHIRGVHVPGRDELEEVVCVCRQNCVSLPHPHVGVRRWHQCLPLTFWDSLSLNLELPALAGLVSWWASPGIFLASAVCKHRLIPSFPGAPIDYFKANSRVSPFDVIALTWRITIWLPNSGCNERPWEKEMP